ncbi:MAG: hypothetical protein ACHBNF_04030 [Chromatiales bacterium]
MKANLNNLLGGAALGLALLAAAVPSWAGLVSKPYTVIGLNSTTGRNYAYGSLRGTRYSADTVQHIGCYIKYSTFGPVLPDLAVRCDAKDSEGDIFACVSTKPEHIASVQSMTDSSEIYLEGTPRPDIVDSCNVIQIYDSSTLLR